MKRLPSSSYVPLTDPLSLRIWEDIAASMEHFTDDSVVSSFFQPEELVAECRLMAASFALLHYSPLPDMEKIHRSRLYGLLFFSLCCGMQIYLKERSITTNYKAYQVTSSPSAIREAKNAVMHELVEGVKMPAHISEIMDLFITQFLPMKERIKRNMRQEVFNEDMFEKFLPVTLVWGYLFAQQVTVDHSS